jgi:hypothetical protein
MRKLLSTVAAMALLGAMMFVQAQAPPKGKGKARTPPKNLKVLDPATFMQTMQTFVPSLGLEDKGGCNFCHVADDRSSDAKQEKVMARMMLEMVKDINARFPDGKQHVTCWTCHRGSTEPEMTK